MAKLSPDQIPPEIVAVCRKLRDQGFSAYLVGGAVRDHLRMPPGQTQAGAKDFDIATSAHPEQVIALFGRKSTVPTGIQHGTVTVLVPRPGGNIGGHREHVEVTTFRGEGAYSDGRRPDQVAFIDDLTEDLRRRDFTINAIAYDPIADLVEDPFGGRADLDRRVLRAVGDAAARFGEDGLRTMRAVRFAAQLGFELEPATLGAIPDALPTLRKVSWERIRDELLKLLSAAAPSRGLQLMHGTGLLQVVLPELVKQVPPAGLAPLFQAADRLPREPILRLGGLLFPLRLPGAPRKPAPPFEAAVTRLKLSARERDRLLALLGAQEIDYSPEWTPAQVRRFLSKVPAGLRDDLFAVTEARLDAEGRGAEFAAPSGLGALRRRAAEELAGGPALSIGELALSGQDVMGLLGLPPGRAVGEILARLLERVLDDPALNTPERLGALVLGQGAGGEGEKDRGA